jgi:zinc protease
MRETTNVGMALPNLCRAALVALSACASRPSSPTPVQSLAPVAAPPLAIQPTPLGTPDAPFREKAPAPGAAIPWAPPRIDTWSMANGVRVLFAERHDVPIVGVRVVSRVGAGDLPGVRPGVVAFMGEMLEQGAGNHTALEISDRYEELGADHGAWCDFDACVVRAKVLTSRLDAALDLLADIALRPTFYDPEIERARKRWLASLEQEKSSPGAMEQNALAASLFGRAHPYGHSLKGVPADIAELKKQEISQAWRRAVQPRSTALVVAGDVRPEELRPTLEARFGAWRGRARETRAITPPPLASQPPREPKDKSGGVRVVLLDLPGAAQSQVYVAQEGVPYGSPDRIALGVMNSILGGMFSSRINLDLREARAYTYGARSRLSMRHGAGPFAAGGAIFTEHTVDAVRALLAHVARMRQERVSDEELADAKENAKLALPARFEGVDDVAGALQDVAVYDLPLDEYATRAARIDAVTVDEVQRVAKKWLHPEAMHVIVAGDRARVEKELTSFGPIELRDAYGEPVK